MEAVILEAGVSHITTVDYVKLISSHPQIDTVTHEQMNKRFLDGSLPKFDAVVTFSSLEHSGLGRYGDDLNPYGDLIVMAKAWCLVRDEGGMALVAVPTGIDEVQFNAHRIYGKVMLPHLFANWKQIYTEADLSRVGQHNYLYQPIHILEKILPEK